MGMVDKRPCRLNQHCMRQEFEEWDLNEEGICQGCEAVEYYLDRDDKHQVIRLADIKPDFEHEIYSTDCNMWFHHKPQRLLMTDHAYRILKDCDFAGFMGFKEVVDYKDITDEDDE